MIPLVRIINSVIRRFGRAHSKNPALVMEILFQHSHLQKHILSLDNVYEVNNYFHGKIAGRFCFVLFCFVLFCFVLLCFVLLCFVLFCLFSSVQIFVIKNYFFSISIKVLEFSIFNFFFLI